MQADCGAFALIKTRLSGSSLGGPECILVESKVSSSWPRRANSVKPGRVGSASTAFPAATVKIGAVLMDSMRAGLYFWAAPAERRARCVGSWVLAWLVKEVDMLDVGCWRGRERGRERGGGSV